MSPNRFKAFSLLLQSPRELWFMYCITLLGYFAHMSLAFILVLFLSENFGYSDKEASWIYAMDGFVSAILSVLLGFVVDVFGVKVSLILGISLAMTGRIILFLATSRDVVLFSLIVVIPLAVPFLRTSISTGIRRYTNDSNRSFAFALFVVVTNFGTMLAAPTVDLLRSLFSGSQYRLIILASVATNFLALIFTLFIRRVTLTNSGELVRDRSRGATTALLSNPIATSTPKSVFRTARFWRFALFMLVNVGNATVDRQIEATFPKYMVRTFGPDVPYATFLSLRPLLVMVFVPTLTVLTRSASVFHLVTLGTALEALALLVLALAGNSHYWPYLLFPVLSALGTSLGEPRLSEYVVMVAPKGKEGVFVAFSALPSIFGRFAVGWMSGYLLNSMCDGSSPYQDGKCNGLLLWLSAFAAAASTPLALLLLKPIIMSPDDTMNSNEAADTIDDDRLIPLSYREGIDDGSLPSDPSEWVEDDSGEIANETLFGLIPPRRTPIPANAFDVLVPLKGGTVPGSPAI